MKLTTSRFGEIEIDDKEIIALPEGLIGFAHNKRYVILPHQREGSPFKWLQSVDDSSLAFIIIDPLTFKPDYRPYPNKDSLTDLELNNLSQAEVYALVVIPLKPEKMTANLVAPLIINPEKKLAKQVVLSDSEYGTRHCIVEEMKRFSEVKIAEEFSRKQ